MPSERVHVAVVGAGAIGCYLGALLTDRGHQVTLVGREEQVAAIQREGLCLTGPRPGQQPRVYHPLATTHLEEQPDLVLLTVKSQDVAAACEAMRPFVADAPVVTLQNGIQADGLAASVLAPAMLVGGVVMCAATYLRPGQISVEFPGWLVIGRPFTAPDQRVQWVAGLLGEAVPTYVTRNLPGTRWSKLLSNLNNGLSAASGLPLAEIMRTPAGRSLPAHVMKEGYAVARAAGVSLDHGLYGLRFSAVLDARRRSSTLVALLQGLLGPLLAAAPPRVVSLALVGASRGPLGRLPIRGSTWQSLARGRPTEIDYLNGEVARMGQRLGIPTPYNSHLVELVHEVERTGQFHSVDALAPPDLAANVAARSLA